jgi:hypothetical protein
MRLNLDVPDDWTPGQTLAVRDLLQHILRAGYPIVAVVSPDATTDQIEDIYGRLGVMISEAGLAA